MGMASLLFYWPDMVICGWGPPHLEPPRDYIAAAFDIIIMVNGEMSGSDAFGLEMEGGTKCTSLDGEGDRVQSLFSCTDRPVSNPHNSDIANPLRVDLIR
jgi:hypothetical protein